jgi:hypothetical protein
MTDKLVENIKARIRNQLRIHWAWVRGHDFGEAYKFIEGCINQAVSGSLELDKIDKDNHEK